MISAVTYGIYIRVVKERMYNLKQFVIDATFAMTNIAKYRRNVAIDLINTLNLTKEQLLVGLRIAYADSVSPSYLRGISPYLISSDKCIQIKEFERNYYADVMQAMKYRHAKNAGFISFDSKIFVYYLYPVTHDCSLIFLLGLGRFSLLSESLAVDSENLMLSLFRNDEPVTNDKYYAKNAIPTISEAVEHLTYLSAGLYVSAYKKDVYLRVHTLTVLFAALVAVISGTSYLYLVHRIVNHGIAEKEAIINNHFERIPDSGLLFSAADVKKLYSMYNSAFLSDLTRAMGERSFDEDLKALPERGGYLYLSGVDKLKNINDTFDHLLDDEVLTKMVEILKSQIPMDRGKIYHFGGGGFAVIYTGGALGELLSILKEIIHFQVGSISLSTSIGVAHLDECTTIECLKTLADKRLYKSKKSDRAQISWQ